MTNKKHNLDANRFSKMIFTGFYLRGLLDDVTKGDVEPEVYIRVLYDTFKTVTKQIDKELEKDNNLFWASRCKHVFKVFITEFCNPVVKAGNENKPIEPLIITGQRALLKAIFLLGDDVLPKDTPHESLCPERLPLQCKEVWVDVFKDREIVKPTKRSK